MNSRISKDSMFLPMVIIGVLFFVFGFVTWLNGSLIPFLKIVCNLNDFEALFVTFTFYIAYTLMAMPMAKVLKFTGYRYGMIVGLVIMVVGSLLFIPAAYSVNYLFFLGALFVMGAGLTILQTASNPYVIFLGPKESAATRIAIMGLINKLAGVVVPIIFAALVLSDVTDASDFAILVLTEDEIQELSERLIMPYLYFAGILVLVTVILYYSKLPPLKNLITQAGESDGKTSIFQFPQTVLGAMAIFSYLGVEVISGDTINLYGSTLYMENFSILTSFTMSFMVLGYLIGVALIPRFISQTEALLGSALIGLLCIVGVVLSSTEESGISIMLWGWSAIPTLPNSVFFVALMGLANAMVWPSIWPLALDGLGKFTAQGSALLIMGVAGGALLPLTFGKLAQTFGDMQIAYWTCFPCYLFILFYAVKGHKIRSWK